MALGGPQEMNGPIVAVTDDVTLVVFHGRPEAQPKKKKRTREKECVKEKETHGRLLTL